MKKAGKGRDPEKAPGKMKVLQKLRSFILYFYGHMLFTLHMK